MPFHEEQVIKKNFIFEDEKLQASGEDRKGRGYSLPSFHKLLCASLILEVLTHCEVRVILRKHAFAVNLLEKSKLI